MQETGPSAEAEAESFGHPIFGLAPLRLIAVHRIRYRSGNAQNSEISLALGTIKPSELIDPSQLLGIYGAGRFQLNPIGPSGNLVARPKRFDVPDPESGSLDLVAPTVDSESPNHAPTVPAQGVVVNPTPAPSGIEQVLRDVMKDMREQRSQDFGLFTTIHNGLVQQLGARSTAAGAVSTDDSYQRFLKDERERLVRENGDLRTRNERLTIAQIRQQVAGNGGAPDASDLEFFKPVIAGVMAKMGIPMPALRVKQVAGAAAPTAAVRGAGAPAPEAKPTEAASSEASPAEEGDDYVEGDEDGDGLPDAETFRLYVMNGGVVPRGDIRALVRLHKAGAVPEALWQLVEPIAEQYGLIVPSEGA